MTPILAQIPGWSISLLAIVFLLVCLSLILIVLIQRPQGGGLSGAFGSGGGAGQTAFGTKTGDVLTLVTIGIFVLFLGTAIGLNFAVRPPKVPSVAEQVETPEAAETEQATQRTLDEMTDDGVPVDGTETDQPAGVPADTDTDGDQGEPESDAPTAPDTGDTPPDAPPSDGNP